MNKTVILVAHNNFRVLINAPTYFWVTYAVAASLWLVSSVLNLAKKFVEWSDKL